MGGDWAFTSLSSVLGFTSSNFGLESEPADPDDPAGEEADADAAVSVVINRAQAGVDVGCGTEPRRSDVCDGKGRKSSRLRKEVVSV